MKQFAKDSNIIKTVAIWGDFIILNLILTLFYKLFEFTDPSFHKIGLQVYIVVINLCYIPCISVFKVVLHSRIVRPEQIVSRVFYTLLSHFVLSISVLGVMNIPSFSKTFIFSLYVCLFLLISSWRLYLRVRVKKHREKGKNLRTTIFIGYEGNAEELYELLNKSLTYGYKILGVFLKKKEEVSEKEINYLGTIDDVIPWLKNQPVNDVFCSLPPIYKDQILDIINYCENNMIRYYDIPNVRFYLKRKMKLELFENIPVLCIREEPLLQVENRFIKRFFDFFCSTIFLVTLYPIIYAIIGSIIKITSPGPIYFKQERSGENGEIFKCIKFRSMKVNKDSDTVQATENDPRKTKFGNFLRKSNIDELPQFLNVWKGEMSMVGPRPHMLKHTEMYSEAINKYMVRHLVKPGITGWAQVNGYRGETKELFQMEGRVKRDIWYIENWSFLLDLRIIIKTITNIILGDKQAY